MDENKVACEKIVLRIYDAIDTEIGGERREYKTETEQVLADIQLLLNEALGLPEDHTL